MSGQSRATGPIRFGVFELDPASGELRKHGTRVRLQEQPFQVLLALLERPGEVVSREELQQRLWPDGTFVDYEDGLATAVRKVRAALGDSATNPRFVETLPKRGYRFLAPVEGLAPSAEVADEPPRVDTESGSHRTRYALAAGVAVSLVVSAALWSIRPRPAPEAPLLPVPLTAYPGAETQPSFSPDGSQVAFCWMGEDGENQDIYLTTVDGGGRSRLTHNPGPDLAPAWSPDGSLIAFARPAEDAEDSYEIYVVSPLGGRERKLTEIREKGITLSWAPDGKTLAITHSPSPGAPVQVGLLGVGSGELRFLALPQSDSFHQVSHPAFSPSGTELAFIRYRQFPISEIFVTAVDGSSARQISNLGLNILSLAWSPDGSELLFSTLDLSAGIWRISKEGGEPRPILELGKAVGDISVSASTNRLVYSAGNKYQNSRFGAAWDVWRISLGEDRESTRLIASTRSDVQAQISPDGSQIAYRSTRTGYPEIWVSDRDGDNEAPLTTMRTSGGGTPRWSPNGRQIAFNSNLEGSLDIYVMPADGGPAKALTTGDSSDARPAWSHDGRWIYYQSNQGQIQNVWRVPSNGGRAEQITTDGGMNPKPSPDGATLYFTKPGTGSVLRMNLGNRGAEPVLDLGAGRNSGCFEPLEDGLHYLTENGVLYRRDYESGQTTEIAVLERSFGPVNCFSLSPDRSWLLYQRRDPPEADLMLVENFR